MAQTKRRRQTKHRGNAAGIVESRGRTGRAPTAAERNPKLAKGKSSAAARRAARYDKAPTWRSAFNRALIAAVLMIVLATVLTRKLSTALALFPIVLILYVPIGYYSDLWIYRRHQRRKASGPAR